MQKSMGLHYQIAVTYLKKLQVRIRMVILVVTFINAVITSTVHLLRIHNTGSSAMMGSAMLPPLNALTNLTCRDDFFERNFTCLPLCDTWDARRQGTIAKLEDIIRAATDVLDIIGSVLVLFVFVMRRKTL